MKKIIFTLISIICLLNARTAHAQWLWAAGAAGTHGDWADATTTDAAGNVFVTGHFMSDSVTFGSVTLHNSGSFGTADFFIAKYDPAGNLLWAATASSGLSGFEYGNDIAVDAAGNAVVTGSFSGQITFNTITLTSAGSTDAFVVKYSPSGNEIWAVNFGGTNGEEGHGIATGPNGDIFITGFFKSASITLGATTLTNTSVTGAQDIYVARLGASGNVLWARKFGGTSGEFVYGMASDNLGNAAVTGYYFSSTMTIGPTTLVNVGGSDVYVVQYDSSGNALWAATGGGLSDEYGYAIAADASGNVVITGLYNPGSATFGTTTLTNAGMWDIYIVKYSSSGNFLWAKGVGGSGGDWSHGITTDAGGNISVTGICLSSSVNFGSFIYTSAGLSSLIVFQFSPSGNALWARSAVAPLGGDITSQDIATDAAGNMYITGHFAAQPAVFGSDTLNNSGSVDVFVAALSAFTDITEEESGNSPLIIFPNPASDELYFNGYMLSEKSVIEIYDVMGKKVFPSPLSSPFLKERGARSKVIDVSSLSPGIYFVKVRGKNEERVAKFIKQ